MKDHGEELQLIQEEDPFYEDDIPLDAAKRRAQGRRRRPRGLRAWSSIISNTSFRFIAGFLILILFFNVFFRSPFSSRTSNGHLRPAIHYAPKAEGWLNDPNGLFQDSNGLWHMYWQHLPSYEPSDCKSWAHSTSPDLYNWTDHAIALKCHKYGMWSGSIVLDTNNTSGLFPSDHIGDKVVAIFTQHDLASRSEEQALAYSLDGGYTFELYAQNPVLRRSGASLNFRDPKVFWHKETGRWVMIVAYAHEQKIAIYTSSNLIEWDYRSVFTNPYLTSTEPTFECPNLVQVPLYNSTPAYPFPTPPETYDPASPPTAPTLPESNSTYILLLSSGSGSPYNGGSLTRYFPGSFNGTHFSPIDSRADRIIDFGPDNYATQFFANTPETSIHSSDPSTIPTTIGWAANLRNCAYPPSGPREGWRGLMTLPRLGALVRTAGDIHYWSPPVGLEEWVGEKLLSAVVDKDGTHTVNYSQVASGAIQLDMSFNIVGDDRAAYEAGSHVSLIWRASKSGEEVKCTISWKAAGPAISCDRRSAAGFALVGEELGDAMETMSVTDIPRDENAVNALEISAVVDHSVLEMFLNGGLKAGTMTMFPRERLDMLVIRTSGFKGKVEAKVEVRGLNRPS
ncbi:Arabinanase/levansucrase/invertase [Microthyrium microscopicum]|uniref:Arabinanase/levansucrase/invertase n=1 Tax=Microthyrium microscopicum TaxID=703497 RepID=A0A6A6TZ52_9PEZI|nr:Arabinanase/levansucrase/invertase [Microthyrium microscopicum]